MRSSRWLLFLVAVPLWPAVAGPDAGRGAYAGHGVGSVPAEVLAAHAPKPLPADLSRRIQLMMDVRAPGLGLVSPDGARLFFGWSVTGSNQVWRVDGPERFPVQLTGGEDRTRVADVFHDGKTLDIQRDR